MFRVTIEKEPPKEWPTLSKAYYAINRAYAQRKRVRWQIDDLDAKTTCRRTMDRAIWESHAESPSAFGRWLNAMGWVEGPGTPHPPTANPDL